jgi:UDP-N-acetylglucosamine--N-acetylmuramyl-(pentapeptide) pyrophosphoryl-undecaprenol N-acetylglucosamine transferase
VDLVQGTYAAWRTMKRTRPDAIFATGGFVSVPVVVAGWLRGIPSLVYLPDLEPGLAVKALARIAKRIAVTTEESTGFFQPSNVILSGYPVRSAFGSLSRDDARKRLGLGDGKVVLVFGGSRGAHAINVAVQGVLESLLGLCELVHVCGQEDFAALSETRDRLAQPIQARYHLHAYLHDEMPAAIKAADLVVSRSGASVLGEFTAAGVPSVLVPYPYAGEHQRKNAAYLQERRAAVVIGNGDLSSALLPTVRALLADESRLRNMKECAARLGRPDAAARLASLLRLLPSEKAT